MSQDSGPFFVWIPLHINAIPKAGTPQTRQMVLPAPANARYSQGADAR